MLNYFILKMFLKYILIITVVKAAPNFDFGTEIPPYELEELSPLEEYVNRPDPYFRYERHAECEEETATFKCN